MLFEEKSHFIFPTNCFIVDGAERSLIYDLQRLDYDIITKDLSAAIKKCTSGSFVDLFNYLPLDDHDFYEPFIRELIRKDHIIPIDADEVGNFEAMSTNWNYPYAISNVVIEFSKDSPYNLVELLKKIDQLNCPAVEIRFLDSHDFSFFQQLSRIIDGMVFRHIDLLIRFKDNQEDDFMFELKQLRPVFFSITQYDSPDEKIIKNIHDQYVGLKRTKRSYSELVNNHGVFPRNFYINREFFTESLKYNSFFNGKIVVLKDGTIKNGTNQPHSFGNINDVDFLELSKDSAFTLLWHISKDKINVCKDCEYRYMCMDSRIPIKNEFEEWTYPESCNYDPYTCKWSNIE